MANRTIDGKTTAMPTMLRIKAGGREWPIINGDVDRVILQVAWAAKMYGHAEIRDDQDNLVGEQAAEEQDPRIYAATVAAKRGFDLATGMATETTDGTPPPAHTTRNAWGEKT